MAEPEEGAEGGEAKPARKLPDTQTLLVLINTLLVIAALGALVYTKLIYQKPAIVEETEIKRKLEESKKPPEFIERPVITFDQMTINIAMTSGKAHYATLALALECRDQDAGALVKAKKAVITDKLIASLGHRQVTELNTIQGKLLLKTELMREFNALIQSDAITDVFFPAFVVQ